MDSKKRRPGCGRKKGEPTEVISFRINKDLYTNLKLTHNGSLNGKVKDFLSSLASK